MDCSQPATERNIGRKPNLVMNVIHFRAVQCRAGEIDGPSGEGLVTEDRAQPRDVPPPCAGGS